MKQSICTVARQWLGTPFHCHGRIKNVGCDCLGLIMGVAHELNLKTRFGHPITDLDRSNYHLIHDGAILLQELNYNLNKCHELDIGQLALLSFDNNPQHMAIIVDYPHAGELAIIHAHMSERKVVEHRLDSRLRGNLIATYDLSRETTAN